MYECTVKSENLSGSSFFDDLAEKLLGNLIFGVQVEIQHQKQVTLQLMIPLSLEKTWRNEQQFEFFEFIEF